MNVVERVVEIAGSWAFEEISLAWGVEDELKNLKRSTSIIQAVLLDAEAKQATNPPLKVWLDELKNVFYDAEDILDEFEVEDDKRKFVKAGSIARKVRRFFSPSNPIVFRPKMAHKLKSINQKLDKIVAEKKNFDLVEREENRRMIMNEKREVAHLFMHVPDIIGRDRDKENVIQFLLHSGHAAGDTPVIPIVGIGGSGKTAFAKLVYEDKRVDEHFELKMWVCVSVDFDFRTLIEKIIKSATRGTVLGESYSHLGMEELLRLLREKIGGKKYLLVFDDVWNDEPVEWNQLKGLLCIGSGSKIMVTTRSDKVASVVGTVHAYDLPGLPRDECMSLFVKTAFKGGWQEAERHQELVEIGEHIVTKCGGVPLAIITLGAMLLSTRSVSEWKRIRENEIWELEQNENHILPSLRLSYEQLTPQLKKCFVSCAAFPKDHLFVDADIISFWMAHGLLRSSHRNQDPEDVGRHFMEELWLRCFFQDLEESEGFITYKMHDLVHDLALSLAENEFFMVNGSRHIPKNARHLSFPDPELLPEDLSSVLGNLDRVRSFGTFELRNKGLSQSIIFACLPRFKYLRLLELQCTKFEVLPRSIGTLKHLRYLSVAFNHQLKKLPSSICNLHSLQSLLFNGCWGIEELPRGLRYMINLRFLGICTKQKVLPNCGLGRLRFLRHLNVSGFRNLEYLSEDIKGLSCLRQLMIFSCQRLISLPEGTKYLTALETLSISNCRNLKELPGCLQDLTSLQQLWIDDCPLLEERCQPETGEDWPKIKHIPRVWISGKNIKSGDGSDGSEELGSPRVPE